MEVREVVPTPNPNAQKFVLDRVVFDRPMSFLDASSAIGHPVASRLFAISGVESVLLLGDFITVNKTPGARWAELSKKVKQTLTQMENPPTPK